MNDRVNDQDLAELMAEREQNAMQALMKIAAAGLKDEADTLAREAGLWDQWNAPIKVRPVKLGTWP